MFQQRRNLKVRALIRPSLGRRIAASTFSQREKENQNGFASTR